LAIGTLVRPRIRPIINRVISEKYARAIYSHCNLNQTGN
jgi:hypothetical protein